MVVVNPSTSQNKTQNKTLALASRGIQRPLDGAAAALGVMTAKPIGSTSRSVDPDRFRELREVGCVRTPMHPLRCALACERPRRMRRPMLFGLQLPILRG
jgi:hypothetical protein